MPASLKRISVKLAKVFFTLQELRVSRNIIDVTVLWLHQGLVHLYTRSSDETDFYTIENYYKRMALTEPGI